MSDWARLTVIRILLIVAGLVADDEARKEIKALAAHISVNGPCGLRDRPVTEDE